MDERIRRAALRAAAKTAILVSLSGCYEMHLRPSPLASRDSSDVARDAGEIARDAGDIARDAAPAVDTGPPPVADAGALACADLLGRLAITEPDDTGATWAWGAQFTDERARLDASVGACCMELEDAANTEMPLERMGSPLAMACCDVITTSQHLVSSSSLGCTPWGPACPPEMSDEDDVELA